MGCGRKRIPSLLDSDTQVTAICQKYFEEEILSHIRPSGGEKAEAHQLFQLTAGNHEKLPMSIYVELNLDFLCQKLGFLLPKNPVNFWMNAMKRTHLASSAGI